MSVKPDKSYFIDYKPLSEKIDLVERVRSGVNQAKADGFKYAFIIEDDDFYPADYFGRFDIGEHTYYGSQETFYYNLKNRTYSEFHHNNRSSLFITGFKISELDNFTWTAPKNRFLDISLWEHSASSKGIRQFISNTGAIGIKHNIGLCAGKGHVNRGANTDDSLEKLKSLVDSEAFDFYSDLMKRL